MVKGKVSVALTATAISLSLVNSSTSCETALWLTVVASLCFMSLLLTHLSFDY